MPVKTPDQVKAEFRRKGLSVSRWAIEHRFNPMIVYELLAGRKKGERGEAHRAAVLLGLKDGEIAPAPGTPAVQPPARRRAA